MRLRHLATTTLLVASLTLVGCGGGSGSDGGAEKDAPPSETTEAAAGGTTSGATVDIVDFAFDPDALEVKAGETVTFTNEDSAKHTATAGDDAPEAFDTGDIAEGESAEVTFDAEGDYKYICSIHDYMTGTVTVTK